MCVKAPIRRKRDTDRQSRRDFLRDSALASAGLVTTALGAGRANAQRQSPTESRQQARYHGYVSIQDDNRIRTFTIEAATGRLAWQEDVAVDGGPAPMALNPGQNVLYVGKREHDEITSYRIDQRTGRLSLIGSVHLQGEPVHLSVDGTGRFVLAAYWHQSTIGVHAVSSNGDVTFPPIEWRYTASGCHGIFADPTNRFVFVPHTANVAFHPGQPNAIFQFTFDENTGRLTPSDPPKLSLQERLGPRHLCFHPTRDIVYSSNEQGSSVTAYTLDPSAGTLTPFQTVSTLPEGYSGSNTCSQIQIAPSGRFLYVPNRGHDSVASFTVDASTGRLTPTGTVPTEARPRAFSLDPDGRFLLVAGRDSGRLASYEVDQDNGTLTPLDTYEAGTAPLWVSIIKLMG